MRPVVIGGGVAGAAVAAHLARAGRAPILIEREAADAHKVCGEFISGEAAALLAQLGIELGALGAATIDRVRLVHRRRIAEARLPFAAWGLSRRRLDAALLDGAARFGAEVRRGVAARGLEGDRVLLAAGTLPASAVFVATGKHELRGARRIAAAPPLVGLKLHLRPGPRLAAWLAGVVELHLFRGGYAGLQLIEKGLANLCLIGPAERFGGAGRSAAALMTAVAAEIPDLAERLGDAAPAWTRPLAVARIPYGYLHRPAPGESDTLYRLGDQAAVIPSLTGDGVAIALQSAAWAARSPGAILYHTRLRHVLSRPMRTASLLHRLMLAQPWAATMAGRLMPRMLDLAARQTRVPGAPLTAARSLARTVLEGFDAAQSRRGKPSA